MNGSSAKGVKTLLHPASAHEKGLAMTTVTSAATSVTSVTLEVPDPAAAGAFCSAAFDLDTRVRFRASEAPTSGFRGFTLSLVVSQPANVDRLIGAALDAGATVL